ncbi:PLP-dependent aminotransferase family protein [Lampropedia puyangensis]|uniref:PLP-dependent aminotransferase family protein n=1 Tax=Lampropedia puyangensis TaxID=1330072 RepID=A0A4S8EZE2_9BURK|nr:PLP-dependent aminotransferase family protein [Lampropedia puyangensis]
MRQHDQTLLEQIVRMVEHKITSLGLRPGSRLPSIRAMAEHLCVSRFTVVEAYEQLTMKGWLQARRGAGYFVNARPIPRDADSLSAHHAAAGASAQPITPTTMDVSWLLESTLRDMGGRFNPGTSALMPKAWLDSELVASAIRSVGRTPCTSLLGYGDARGYLPLRISLTEQLQNIGIAAHAEQHLLLTAGVTHATDLALRTLTTPGDTVLVEDPAWYLVFARLAAAGVRVVGVPRTPSGPDLNILEELVRTHRPKLFFINSAVHNPTGYSLSPRSAHTILKLAQEYDFHILEDDTYGELHPGGAIRIAALDGLERVLFTGGFSKPLAAGLRVGYIAASSKLTTRLTELKMLSGLTTPELPERVLQHILASGLYSKHLHRLRQFVDNARMQALDFLQSLDLAPQPAPHAGLFIWLNCQQDSEQLARRSAAQGLILAPGRLFSPAQVPDTHIRLSVSLTESAETMALFKKLLTNP